MSGYSFVVTKAQVRIRGKNEHAETASPHDPSWEDRRFLAAGMLLPAAACPDGHPPGGAGENLFLTSTVHTMHRGEIMSAPDPLPRPGEVRVVLAFAFAMFLLVGQVVLLSPYKEYFQGMHPVVLVFAFVLPTLGGGAVLKGGALCKWFVTSIASLTLIAWLAVILWKDLPLSILAK